jgi:glycosyltransferase involved in cell wall biosynthesis
VIIGKLTKYGSSAASTRQRFDQYDPFLAAEGFSTVPLPILDNDYLAALYDGRRNVSHIIRRYLNRFVQIAQTARMDLIWVHCEVFPFLPGIMDRLVKLSGKPIVFDFDDAIFHNYDQSGNAFVRKLLGNRLSHILGCSSFALCGNDYLRRYAERYCGSTQVVPTVLNTNQYRPAPFIDDTLGANIGWIGSPSTWREYMQPIMPMLVNIAAAHNARLTAIGAGSAADEWPTLTGRPWTLDSEISAIQSMDIGIMPLDDSPWARGKCAYKLIQYMACGLPVVASPVGMNIDIIENGVNGFLASNEAEWRGALSTLLKDKDLRRRMGATGRQRIEQEYSLNVWGPRVARLLSDIARGASGEYCRI